MTSPSLPNLAWLRTFEAAARLLNFTLAGEELGLTQAAVSQQIRSLESKLGCDLFVRQHRKLTLTDMGRAYLPAVQKSLHDLTLTTRGLFGPGFDNLVTVRVPISTALLWLTPKMHLFRKAHPDIRVRLVSSFWNNNLSGERVDVEVRLGHGNWEGLRAEKISSENLVPICAKGQAKRFQQPEDFLTLPLIHIIGFDDNWTRYFAARGLDGSIGRFGVSVDTTAAAVSLVAHQEGCAAVIERFADQAKASGQKIDKAGEPLPFPQSHYLVTALDSSQGTSQGSALDRPTERPQVAAFKDWLRTVF